MSVRMVHSKSTLWHLWCCSTTSMTNQWHFASIIEFCNPFQCVLWLFNVKMCFCDLILLRSIMAKFLEHNGLYVEHNWHKLWASKHSIILWFWSIIFSPLHWSKRIAWPIVLGMVFIMYTKSISFHYVPTFICKPMEGTNIILQQWLLACLHSKPVPMHWCLCTQKHNVKVWLYKLMFL